MSADLIAQETSDEPTDQTTLVLVTESGKTNKKEETILEESQKAKEVQTTENVLYQNAAKMIVVQISDNAKKQTEIQLA
jgi:hypothetical protein